MVKKERLRPFEVNRRAIFLFTEGDEGEKGDTVKIVFLTKKECITDA